MLRTSQVLVALTVLSACQIAPDNRFDPETDPAAQAPASISGTISNDDGPLAFATATFG